MTLTHQPVLTKSTGQAGVAETKKKRSHTRHHVAIKNKRAGWDFEKKEQKQKKKHFFRFCLIGFRIQAGSD